LRHLGVPFGHAPLNIKRATDRVHNAAELGQESIAGILDDSPAVFTDFWIDYGAQMVCELGVCPLFVGSSQPAIPSHIGRQDSRQSTFNARKRVPRSVKSI
jgi:hypothetical protein